MNSAFKVLPAISPAINLFKAHLLLKAASITILILFAITLVAFNIYQAKSPAVLAIADTDPSLVIDNTDPGFFVLSGNDQNVNPRAVGAPTYSWALRANLGDDARDPNDDIEPLTTFAWYYQSLETGVYQVHTKWDANPTAATDAQYLVQTSDSRIATFVNQTQAPRGDYVDLDGSLWELVGTVQVGHDGVLDVKLPSNSETGQIIMADTVRIKKIDQLFPPVVRPVIEPWTSLVTDQALNHVSSFNTTFNIANGPLPSITMDGTAMGTPKLLITQNGVQTEVKSETTIDFARGDQVKFHGVATIDKGEIRWDATIDYDNFYKINTTFVPTNASDPILIDNLQFQWLLPDSMVTIAGVPGIGGHLLPTNPESTLLDFFNGTTDSWSSFFGQRTFTGQTKQRPVMWMGNPDRGVTWQAESDENFDYDLVTGRDGNTRLIHFDRDRNSNAVTMSVQMIHRERGSDPSAIINKPTRFTFSVQTTPVRPPKNARGYKFGSITNDEDSRNVYGWAGAGEGFWGLDAASIPEPPNFTNPESPLYNHTQVWYKGGIFAYSASQVIGHELADQNPEWLRTKWQEPVALPEGKLTSLISSLSNLLLEKAARQLQYDEVVGIYVDVNGVKLNDNRLAGAYRVDNNGRPIIAWDVWTSLRGFSRDLAQLHASPDKLLIYHQHNDDVAAVHGWSDFTLPGEDSFHRIGIDPMSYIEPPHLVDVLVNENDGQVVKQYLLGYALEYWQSHKRMGSNVLFIPQTYRAATGGPPTNIVDFGTYDPSNSALHRAYIAMLGLHDLGLFVLTNFQDESAHAESLAYVELMQEWKDATFHGYWSQSDYASPNPALVHISYYEDASGDRLVWITNRSEAEQDVLINGTMVTVLPKDFATLKTTNAPPTISTPQDSYTVAAGNTLTFTVTVTDLEGDAVAVEIVNPELFPGATLQ